ncbi:MAG: DUF896 domain-containing protein [Clostridia bacterium]|nr:DUF896 domain-containing protein [Clostridia bacterium]
MEKKKIERINFLARKQRDQGLSDEERAEQSALREEYILGFRASIRGIMDNTYIQRPDGTKTKVEKSKPKPKH